ncbi:hypothetical protein IJJ97_07740 [bacterium]|nr:hypothetical protein [bacterium]
MSKKSKKKEEVFGSKDVQFITEEEKKNCHVLIHTHAVAAGAGNVVPIPGVGIAADVATMTTMAIALSKIFNDKPLTWEVASNLVTGVLKNWALKQPIRMAAKELSKLVPGLGQVVAPTISIGMIESAGWILVNKFAKERHDREKEERARMEAIKAKEMINSQADSMFNKDSIATSKPLVISDLKTSGLPKAQVLKTSEEEIKKPFLASKVKLSSTNNNLSNAGSMKLVNSDVSAKPSLDNSLLNKSNSVDVLGSKSDLSSIKENTFFIEALSKSKTKLTTSNIKTRLTNKDKISQLESDLKQLTIERTNTSSLPCPENNLRNSALIDRSRFDKKALKLEDDLKSFARQREM